MLGALTRASKPGCDVETHGWGQVIHFASMDAMRTIKRLMRRVEIEELPGEGVGHISEAEAFETVRAEMSERAQAESDEIAYWSWRKWRTNRRRQAEILARQAHNTSPIPGEAFHAHFTPR